MKCTFPLLANIDTQDKETVICYRILPKYLNQQHNCCSVFISYKKDFFLFQNMRNGTLYLSNSFTVFS